MLSGSRARLARDDRLKYSLAGIDSTSVVHISARFEIRTTSHTRVFVSMRSISGR